MLTATSGIDPRVIAELSPPLLRYAMRLARHREDAEDLVQETWISALRSASTFTGRSSLRTWLTTILRRRASDRFRRASFAQTFVDEVWHEQDLPSDMSVNLLEQRERNEWAALALRALDELPAAERSAVLLCDVQVLERDEAAERLCVTRSHLRVLLFRGRNKLEVHLRELGYGL